MSFFAGLNEEKYDRHYSDRELLVRIVNCFRPQGGRLVLISLIVLIIAGLGALSPWVVSRGVDWIRQTSSSNGMFVIAGAVLAIGVLSWFMNWARQRLTARAIADILYRLTTDAFQAAVEHDLSFYDALSSGKVVSRITSDTREFGNFVTLTTDLVSQVVESVILGVILYQIEKRLALAIFALVPLVFAMALAYRRLARKVTRQGMQAMAGVNATIKETISGIAVAKNYRQEAAIYESFHEANTLSYRVNVRRGLVLSIVFPTLNALGGLATAALVYAGGLSAAQGLVTAGSWYLFLLSLDRFLFPVMNLASFWTQIQSGLSAAERVFSLIDAQPNVRQIAAVQPPRLRGEIEFINLSFRYRDEEPLLEGFNLHIRAGENLALVGHTGSGKTSVARLIARFYEFQDGQLLIDGYDIRTFDLRAYRKQLGIVSQVPFLFSGTVLDNIRYANPNASLEEIEALARQIGEGEWLESLPQGLLTPVGERGSRLSMGQRQLVALMRVLVQKPAIFILDEATASIDPFTEWQIQQALNLILRQSTSILIAHRLSTVRSADRIIVLDKGRIIEEGNHDQLLSRGGHYATLYNLYFRHQSLAYIEESRTLATGN